MDTATEAIARRLEARAEPRTNLFVLATIVAGSGSGPVKVRNLSPHGALVEGASLPGPGHPIQLNRGGSSIRGTVVWCSDGKAGLRFDGIVDVAGWMPGPHTGQQRVDQVFQQVKADAAASQPGLGAAGETDPLAPPQLRRLARAIDALADDLAEDGAVIARHAIKLQALDIASQVLRRLAEQPG